MEKVFLFTSISPLELVENSLTNFFEKIAGFAPALIGALFVLIIGWIIAKLLKWAVQKVLKTIGFDGITDKIGINSFLVKGGIKKTSSQLISSLFYWVIMLSVWLMFFDTLGLEVVSNLLTEVVKFIPNILIACLLLVVGMYLAEFVSGIVVGTLKGGDYENPEFLGKIAYGAVTFFTIAMALSQLGIGQDLINSAVNIILGALGVGLALAFGLGGKDWASDMIDKYLR